VGCFLIGKQNVVLFPTFRKNEGEGKLLGMLLSSKALKEPSATSSDLIGGGHLEE
jgi:hypothetical protein